MKNPLPIKKFPSLGRVPPLGGGVVASPRPFKNFLPYKKSLAKPVSAKGAGQYGTARNFTRNFLNGTVLPPRKSNADKYRN
jgi:hypothetical protein